MTDTRPCCLCGREMECAIYSWSTFQPYGGGELRLIFDYGSVKFDGDPAYRLLVCDNCGEKIINGTFSTTIGSYCT